MSALRDMQLQLADAMRAQTMPRVASLRGDGVAGEADRLAVYHHGYRARLREALATEFPGLALLAGRRFAALLDDYVAAHPSTHFNIRWHGAGLADFLATALVSASAVAVIHSVDLFFTCIPYRWIGGGMATPSADWASRSLRERAH